MNNTDAFRFLQQEVTRLRDENRDLRQELTLLRSSIRALSALQDILQRLTPGANVLGLLDDLLASALAVVGANDGSLLLRDDESQELVFAVVHGASRDRLTGYRLPPGKGIAGWVADHRELVVVSDVQQNPHFFPQVDETMGFHTRSLACVPLVDGKRLLGVIEAINKTGDREFDEQDIDLLRLVAELSTIILQRAEALPEEAPPGA